MGHPLSNFEFHLISLSFHEWREGNRSLLVNGYHKIWYLWIMYIGLKTDFRCQISLFLVWLKEHSSNGTWGWWWGWGGGLCSSAYNSLSFQARHLILVLKDRGQLSYCKLSLLWPFFQNLKKVIWHLVDSEEPKKVKVGGLGPNFMEWIFIWI